MTSPEQHPFFSLVNNQCQAEAALSALVCFGNQHEKTYFKPKIKRLKHEWLDAQPSFCLAKKVNTLVASYIHESGELSDQLTIFISKSIGPTHFSASVSKLN
ncbi:MAG: hypothetical protein ACJA1U_001705 [Bermanella sp.]|jgi:hypothetical protein